MHCRDHRQFVCGSDVEVDSAIWRIFILRFGFSNILLLLCVGIIKNLSVFSLINYFCRIANLFSFHKMYTFFIITLTVNVAMDNLLWSMMEY